VRAAGSPVLRDAVAEMDRVVIDIAMLVLVRFIDFAGDPVQARDGLRFAGIEPAPFHHRQTSALFRRCEGLGAEDNAGSPARKTVNNSADAHRTCPSPLACVSTAPPPARVQVILAVAVAGRNRRGGGDHLAGRDHTREAMKCVNRASRQRSVAVATDDRERRCDRAHARDRARDEVRAPTRSARRNP
jgi:hypothetical protein